ncbi:type II toxin-antitoxin system RelE/ParE family toxin [Zavarzinia compransoris]|uniref:Type II toxin-antitoxin system mRNA interferase toxin, RelE/StbE family n=1 Tax=Zavarzinia compransoris TaxID=1264899 RepID=A0A317E5C3_9PROT|nr:type II toxin-antitoxin system RelE/ParE family toxin [Zavarzinia compransoris]PWR21782.1 type II toxin-antitoxin system mRNA interferase toxin, RelE/StbE family [Zavarzinia compransoris]TDP45419.1 addiction module RelE/StbE family toxin [Zavarzinia compransoris]
MKLRWSRQARTDRQDIRAFIARDNPMAALALDRQLADRASQLVFNPHQGRKGRLPGTRELVAHHNYVLVYAVTDDAVQILRVLHVARRWP